MDDVNFAFDKIWKLKVPPRVRNFLWMLAINRVPTKDFLMKRGKGVVYGNADISFQDESIVVVRLSAGSSKPITLGWRYLLHGWLKFNVSGLATEEAMGCGGVLRDEEGNVRALFSRPWWRGAGLTIVEIGSLVTYNWLLNKDRRPWSQQTTFADMERRLACVDEVTFSKAE
ncbi:hypothetical protein Goklo_008351 [Gossypium klotzschianum]|uniref:Reverse transcriptase zinc-binding domain-containing protein n=1 Tax=Gossypium klotzschianum TaxID=34286 RepID=A0A7J8UZJ3_9ROSI|nr:hypothetical protein [Gossypium klotzschianum]